MSTIEQPMHWAVIVLTLFLASSGCSDSSTAPAPPPSTKADTPLPDTPTTPSGNNVELPTPRPADAAAGGTAYLGYCASCHGATGAGDGPIAAGLNPKPAKHNDGTFMNALTDDYLFQVIKEGGVSVGKSPLMAPWGGLLSDQQIRDIIAFTRSLADPPYQP